MSLHKFADMVAKQGRGDDSLLIHMTPDEVQRLQSFAQANGRSLTINPETGLPEAGMLSDLFKAVAPIALGAFLGPGAFGIAGLGLSATTAGLVTGGLTTLATGSLSRGLMAGLGAYGGAGMAEGLAGTGAGALGQKASEATAMELMNAGAGEGLTGEAYNQAFQQSVTDKMAALTPEAKMAAGLDVAKASPMDYLKNNWQPLAAAAAPIMAGAMVPTTTSIPTSGNTGFIRQKIVNPDGTVRDLTPVKASEWGDRNFSDVYRGYNGGGIVALAGGGNVQHFAVGDVVKADIDKAYAAGDFAKVNELAQANKITAADVGETWKGFDTSGLAGLGVNLYTPPAGGDSGAAAPAYTQYTDQQFTDYFTKTPNADIAKDIVTYNADPAAVNRYLASITSPFVGSTDTTGGSGTLGIYNRMVAEGIDPNEYYSATIAANPKYAGWSKEDIQRGYNLDKGAYALSAAEKDGVSDKEWVNFMDTNKYSVNDMAQAFGLSRNEVQRRYDAVKNAEKKVVTPITTVTGVTPGGNYGNATNPGDITTNPDGTVTVHPNIPYRPDGGFSGMGEVKDAYTKGGGSLGYKAKAPETIEEFNQMFNKQTGDSLAAYDYLMGKGGAKYPTKSGVGEIARPYSEATLGYPASTNKMYNWDPVAGKMVRNFDYVAPGRDAKGNVTYGMSLNDVKKALSDKPLEGQALYDWAMTNNLSAQDIADATGMQLSAVYAQFRAGSQAAAKKAEADKAAGITTLVDTGSGGVSGGPGGDGGGTGPGGVGGAGGPGSTTAVNSADMGDVGDADGDLAGGGLTGYAMGGGLGSLGSYSDGGRLLKGPGDGVSDSIPATIGRKRQPARLADGEFVIPARIVSELGNGSTDAGAKKLYAMMDRVQRARGKTTGKNKVAANSRADKYLPA